MFFESYDFIWAAQRPPRNKADIDAALKSLSPEKIESAFTFEDRVAVRSLLYCVIDDINIRNVLDGLMLPPPFAHLDLADRRWSAADVGSIVRVIEPSLDTLLVQLPFHLALRLGSYDARLRAACRRLCWVLNVPFSVVEEREEAVAQLRLTLSREAVALPGERDANADGVLLAGPPSTGPAASARSEREKQEEIAARREQRKRSLKRIATVGGFAVLGGAALVVTGGLVAPLIAPAFAALASATTVTLGAIGAMGSAVLGGTALAAVFTAVVGVGTHAAALASVITPVLTAANVTAIFGVSGATLAGWKAVRRTGDSDTFVIRSVDEIETFTGSAAAAEETPETADEMLAGLANAHQVVEKDEAGLLGTRLDLTSVVEDGSKPGLVVPSHTRAVGMANVSSIHMITKRNRHIVFGVESALKGYELRLKAVKLTAGVWGMAPPPVIPAGSTGICASMNRYMRPSGTGFILCYTAAPVKTSGASASFRLWVRAEYDFLGGWALSSFCEGIDRELDPFKAEMRLETNASDTNYTRTQIGVTMEMHLKPCAYLKVYPAAETVDQARQVTFPLEELPQRQMEYAHDVKQRRKIGVSFVNKSRHLICVADMGIVNGVQWMQTASPMRVEARNASLTFFTNSSWSLEGAEGYYIVEVSNANDSPITPKYFVRLQFEISALNNLNVAVASAPTIRELRQMELTPAAPESNAFPVEVKDGLFFHLSVRLLSKEGIVELHCDNAVERDTTVQVAERATLAIGVCGFSGVFDARRPMQDQQVGLWQPILRATALLGPNESYALQWEDDYLAKFGESIKMDLQVADAVGKKAISKAKSVAKKQLMQGVIFSGFRAFNTFMGAFQLPLYAVWASDVIDNTYATLSNRAVFAGKDLATALLDKARGNRPVSLVGFSFGSKVIAECLKELDRVEAHGVVENAYLMGATFSADRNEWLSLRRVVAGRLVNVYTRSDWALWLMYKANEGELKPMAGISPVSVAGVENVDASAIVQQHSAYALRLGEVLDLIPRCPTEETWSRMSARGSPGVVVPTTAFRKTVKTMGASLGAVLSSNPFSAFALRNCVVSDIPGLSTSLELVAVSTFHCFFDFVPPPSVDPGCAGIFGVIGDEAGEAIGGAFSYRLRLDPFSDRDLLLTVPFYVERNNDISVTARPSLVTQRSSRAESEDDADSRFYTIATQAVVSCDDAKACTIGIAPAATVLTPNAHTATVSFEVPLESVFLDGHQQAVFRVTLSKTNGGVALHVLALANRAASQLQQESFTVDVFDRKYAKAAETAAKAALGILGPSSGGGASAATGAAADGPEASTPSIAEVVSIDHFQSTLFGVAAALTGKAHSGDDVVDDGMVSPATPAREEVYIVMANCGQVSLYFGEEVYAKSAGGDLGSSAHCPSPGAAGDASEEDQLSSSSTLRRTQVRWVRFPPPEIPPQSFCVLCLTDFTSGMFPRLRYETADGACAFDIQSTAPVKATPFSSFSAPASSSPCGSPPAEGAAGCGRMVVCSVVAPLKAADADAESSNVSFGEVSTSTTLVRGVRFHLVLMTPKTSGSGKSFANSAAKDEEVKQALKSYGWFVA